MPLNIFTSSVKTFNLSYIAGPNGSLSGFSSQTVNAGANGTAVAAVPAAGFHFIGWSDGQIANPRTDANVLANISVTANFSIDSASTSGGGSAGNSVNIANNPNKNGLLPFMLPTSGGGGGSSAIVVPSTSNTSTPSSIPPQAQVLGITTFANGTLAKTGDSPTVYLVSGGKFRPISSSQIFLARGFNFSDIQSIKSDLLTSNNLGQVLGYPDGTLIRGSGPTVYLVFGDAKVGIPSMAMLNKLKLSPEKIVSVSDVDLNNYDDGGIVP